MIKNEYRRAFIMLRPAMQGYGGHVRLERRTLTGSMYFIVTAPQDAGTLEAVLAGRQGGEYYTAPIGALTRDRRGQLTLAWQFDPRSVAGRPLESYAWVCVASADGDCRLALIGNVEGSRELDPVALQGAVRALFAPEGEPAADLPEPGEPDPVDLSVESVSTAPDTISTAVQGVSTHDPTGEDGAEEAPSDVKIYTASRTRLATAGASEQRADRQVQSREASAASNGAQTRPMSRKAAPSVPAEDTPMRIELTLEPSSTESASPAPGPDPAQREAAAPAQTAAQELGLDITSAWPDGLEPLKRLFATQAALDVPLPDEYTYISAPMPEASGYSECIVGLRAEGGSPAGVLYALPAARGPVQPAGLEDYLWMDGDGNRGYWVLEVENP